jgi:hypothetical protein
MLGWNTSHPCAAYTCAGWYQVAPNASVHTPDGPPWMTAMVG